LLVVFERWIVADLGPEHDFPVDNHQRVLGILEQLRQAAKIRLRRNTCSPPPALRLVAADSI
jgi:hypothetical protein